MIDCRFFDAIFVFSFVFEMCFNVLLWFSFWICALPAECTWIALLLSGLAVLSCRQEAASAARRIAPDMEHAAARNNVKKELQIWSVTARDHDNEKPKWSQLKIRCTTANTASAKPSTAFSQTRKKNQQDRNKPSRTRQSNCCKSGKDVAWRTKHAVLGTHCSAYFEKLSMQSRREKYTKSSTKTKGAYNDVHSTIDLLQKENLQRNKRQIHQRQN